MSWQILNVTIGQRDTPGRRLGSSSVLVLPATRAGEELAGPLAIKIGGELVGRITAIAVEGDEVVLRRPAFGGRVELETRHRRGPLIASCNEAIAGAGEVVIGSSAELRFDTVPIAACDQSLETAHVVVSGGRGLDADDFARLRDLAVRLDGALGGSLPAVDLGLVPVSRQIGQSGKFVTPAIYLAVGISGTPQHLAGIGAATRIIAINKDPGAAIFRFAEAGAVGDAKQILPRLIAALSKESAHV
jgi:electron transfer flavoprotein alpha subunit